MAKEEVKRIPRLAGLTLQKMQLTKLSPDEQESHLGKIRDFVLYQWLLSSGQLCGTVYSSNDLALYLGCTVSDIQIYMRDQVLNNKMWSPENQRVIAEGLMGQQIAWTLETRMQVQSQLNIMLQSQEGRYKPFISDAVLKTLKLLLESDTSLQSVVRSLSGGNTTNFFIQNNNAGMEPDDSVTYEQALEIIQQTNQKALPGEVPNDMEDACIVMEENYDLASLPEVNAKSQSGINVDKEGLNIENKELKIIVDRNTTSIADEEFEDLEKDVEHHVRRRQKEYEEYDEDEDPEMDIY